MAAIRSRRLEALFGAQLDALTASHLHGLVSAAVQEANDLDFKQALCGRGDSEKRDLASDVAALANTAGGVIVLGIEEDEHACAKGAPGVEVSDAEVTRIRHIVASLVAPIPVFDIITVSDDGTGAEAGDASTSRRGFIIVAVPRSPAAPHAVIVNQGYRYPKRNGTTTRYLSEPEAGPLRSRRLSG